MQFATLLAAQRRKTARCHLFGDVEKI